MKATRPIPVSIEVDKLTNSIENAVTGEAFDTIVSPVAATDLKTTTKKVGWLFNWQQEARRPESIVYKLATVEQPTIIQGLISL